MAAPRVAVAFPLAALLASPPAMAEFDYYHLILRWPGALCSQGMCCKPTTGNPALDFLIAGFVTRSNSGTPVRRCNSSPFDINQLRLLREQLELYWSSVFCPSSNGVFYWKTAWTNYGTCSGLPLPLYFLVPLELRADIDLLSVLKKKRIVPSEKALYAVEDIKSAVQDAVGAAPGISCSSVPNTKGVYQLSEVYVCVGKDYKVIECPLPLGFTCPDSIKFLPFDYSMLNDTSAPLRGNPITIRMPVSV